MCVSVPGWDGWVGRVYVRIPGGTVCRRGPAIHLRTGVFTWEYRWVGGGKEDWIGCGHELLSPHPCTRALSLREQLQSLREELEQVAQKGRARRAQSAELNNDLCKAHRWVSLPCTPPHSPPRDLRSVPGSLWPAAFPCKVGGRSNPSRASPDTQCLPAPF